MRLRFAPSPTGQLHVGNARTALFNWLLARRSGGQFILRIEDTDAERSNAESERAILEDLRWLGLTWDEGPEVGGPVGPYRQSERLGLYQAHAATPACAGAMPTSASARQPSWTWSVSGRWPSRVRPGTRAGAARSRPGEARSRVASGEAAAIRFRVPPVGEVAFDDAVRGRVVFHTDIIGDPVIVRSEGRPAYNFAVVVDDALMGISHVIRGEDHVSNTPRQVLLYARWGTSPPVFAHLALVMGPDHSPLSKRHGATSVREFRERGYLPEALVNYLALIGWSPGGTDEVLPIDELARRFRWRTLARARACSTPRSSRG